MDFINTLQCQAKRIVRQILLEINIYHNNLYFIYTNKIF